MRHLFRKLERRDDLNDAERAALEGSVSRIVECPPRAVIVRENVLLDTSNLLLAGHCCRYKDLPSGQRQILELHVPGDFVDLHSFPLKKLEHNIMTLTPVRIAYVPHVRLKAITETYPHLARMLWFSTMLDAAIHREWLLSLGRRSAIGRLAHLFSELLVRMEVAGLTEGDSYPLPITQIDLADSTGLTAVHVNRMLRELRNTNVMSFRDGRVTIDDLAMLHRMGSFDPAYLYLEKRPR